METVEEPSLNNSSLDVMKAPVVFDKIDESSVVSVQADECHKSNGVAESTEPSGINAADLGASPLAGNILITTNTEIVNNPSENPKEQTALSTCKTDRKVDTKTSDCESQDNVTSIETAVDKDNVTEVIEQVEDNITVQEVEIDESVVAMEPNNDRVTFETEILIENNGNDIEETVIDQTNVHEGHSNNILSGLGENIELTEALRSSDVTENIENNNCHVRQEVFNKEELLDILEGNDEELSNNQIETNLQNIHAEKILETQMALQQLSRLKRKSKKKSVEKQSKAKLKEKIKHIEKRTVSTPIKKEDNIINALVQEWEDDEPAEGKVTENIEKPIKNTNDLIDDQKDISKHEDVSTRTSVDEKTSNINRTGDEGHPQRRLGRVIKKKVIFDPDNPDTFTKCKAVVKSKESGVEKDQQIFKKIKSEQGYQRSKSKSPISKLQWKKPSPKNCKQNKRLTEIDRLLMDEGAVNMIYQLTPEAPKGKKNMKTKAEFIKKIQSSTPDSKEMKFRERKKESKYEEGEAKRILGGKQRPSLSSSVKSPSVCEDFEAHSADDSIIYRRHSSSSYSSSCMSPLRLSDFEGSSQTVNRNPKTQEVEKLATNDGSNDRPEMDVFMSDSTDLIRADVINKDDCLSIKQKLNSKLNLALKKRKRENSKGEKPPKIKKVIKSDEKTDVEVEGFKYLSVMFDDKLAELCIRKSGSKFNVEVIKELETALTVIDGRQDVSVTLLTSECGTLCSDLDLRSLLDSDVEKRTYYAHSVAESIRSLLNIMLHHSKLLCMGVSGRCSGVGMAMVGLSDIAMACERASFSICQKPMGSVPIVPGVAVFSAYRLLSQSLLNDLVVFGRRLSASEALHGGLVSRVLWPERFYEQVRTIAKDITTQSTQNILLKKQLLNLKKSGPESTFLSCLERERDLIVDYWTSDEGQELLRTLYNAS